MSNIRTEVTEMLERRAADIDSPHVTGTSGQGGNPVRLHSTVPLSSGRRWRQPIAVAAVALIAAGVGLYLASTRNGSPGLSTIDTAASPDDLPIDTEPPVTSGLDPAGDVESDGPIEPELLGFDETVAALPGGINLVSGPLIYEGQFGSTAEQIARDYLDERMPDLGYTLTESERVGPMVVYRWSNQYDTEEDVGFSGSVIVRDDVFLPGVVAATTDQVDARSIERTVQRLSGSVKDSDIDLLVVDVFNLRGEILPGSVNPDGFNEGGEPIFGTAGHTDTDLLEFELPAGPIPVVVRFQHVGGTMLSISEFALEAVGFVNECGSQPPISIDVGDLLNPRQVGTKANKTGLLLTNQQAWNYSGASENSPWIEILWPANPTLTNRVPLETFEEGTSLGFTAPTIPTGDTNQFNDPGRAPHVVLFLGGDAADPCSLVQVNVYGDDQVVEWWTSAISGEWAFGMPLSIADLDPAIGPNGTGGEPPSPTELVVASTRAVERPAVPLTGTCDLLPESPPRTGAGLDTSTAEPSEALALLFETGISADPPLPTSGYTEVVIDDTTISYMISYDYPMVVIDLSHDGRGWTVEGWSAAVC